MSLYQAGLDAHWLRWANDAIESLHGCLGGKIIKQMNDSGDRWKDLELGDCVFSLDWGNKDDMPEEEDHYWLDVKHKTAGRFSLRREGFEALRQTVLDISSWSAETFREHVAQSE